MFNDNTKAIYLQIADRICDDILARKYSDESRLPSVREYAAATEVNANTVMRTYDWLAAREIIYNKRGIGFFVSTEAYSRVIELRRSEMFEHVMPKFFHSMSLLGITPDELVDLYNRYLQTKQTDSK